MVFIGLLLRGLLLRDAVKRSAARKQRNRAYTHDLTPGKQLGQRLHRPRGHLAVGGHTRDHLVVPAVHQRFRGLTVLPLSSRPGEPATRVIVRGMKGSRAPLVLLATRALHGTEGNGFAPEFDAILRGTAVLDW